jgi:hypothetical protein
MKLIHITKPSNAYTATMALAVCCTGLLNTSALADTSVSLHAVADSCVFTGVGPNSTGYYDAASRNFGSMNSRQVAGAGNSRGEFDAVIRFDSSAATASLNSQYGAGNWMITGASLTLCTSDNVSGPGIFNAPGAAGLFDVSWMSADGGWLQGSGYKNNGSGAGNAADHNVTGVNFTSGITWNSLHTTLTASPATLLNTCIYQDLGMLVTETFNLGTGSTAFLDSLESGTTASLLLTPDDNTMAFNFTSHSYGGGADPYNPTLTLTIETVPEPGTSALIAGGLLLLCVRRRSRRA